MQKALFSIARNGCAQHGNPPRDRDGVLRGPRARVGRIMGILYWRRGW